MLLSEEKWHTFIVYQTSVSLHLARVSDCTARKCLLHAHTNREDGDQPTNGPCQVVILEENTAENEIFLRNVNVDIFPLKII